MYLISGIYLFITPRYARIHSYLYDYVETKQEPERIENAIRHMTGADLLVLNSEMENA